MSGLFRFKLLMDRNTFLTTWAEQRLPLDLSPWLQALWLDAHGDWEAAHARIQHLEDVDASRIHAYLHRKEGDRANAGYWYDRAGCPMPACSLAEEFDDLLNSLLLKDIAES